MLEKIVYSPIGFVENEFKNSEDSTRIRSAASILAIDEDYLPALEGLERFRHLVVIYHMNRSGGYREKVHPMGEIGLPMRGVLATRSPCRPNPIGLTVVESQGIERSRIKVTGLDALDGTPILDIKPYTEHFDSPQGLQWSAIHATGRVIEKNPIALRQQRANERRRQSCLFWEMCDIWPFKNGTV